MDFVKQPVRGSRPKFCIFCFLISILEKEVSSFYTPQGNDEEDFREGSFVWFYFFFWSLIFVSWAEQTTDFRHHLSRIPVAAEQNYWPLTLYQYIY